ncbi:unnamed protein product [Cuscuta epithymum]|uniref:Uncharacterized protein n=1 Tax=Cuscuta epithymum TaxID=186058 RepID=A0AAV0D0K9_9ASTE|nr:unnamed protein product [Cuscuta epithymum]
MIKSNPNHSPHPLSHNQNQPPPYPYQPLNHLPPNLKHLPHLGEPRIQNVCPPTSTTPYPNPYTIPLDDLISIMLARLISKEDNLNPKQLAHLSLLQTQSACRDSLRDNKRSHEDPDDSDPHEGENKRKRVLEHGASSSHSQPQPNQPSSSNKQQPGSSSQPKTHTTQPITSS